ncbi:C40 family peptidase [Limisalsivibrio acetivorans]|uniref:C40 family peptidase n=1 Tax=Limisalsivibrio acetivorans TaxID=1304888 RepID=UPI0003B5EBFE|nr:NlpC/P60 family protein [Limisalsivibrio acetivorans]
MKTFIRAVLAALILITLSACTTSVSYRVNVPIEFDGGGSNELDIPIENMKYSVQVGAFSVQGNAVNFADSLERSGIDAYFFLHDSGLYKVRFGNYSSYDAARSHAERLNRQGKIDDFFIVRPEDYAVNEKDTPDRGNIRDKIVRTAHRYIGVPYQWGGTNPNTGFDCSGLTMVVYKYNGLNLPRTSREQYKTGRYVKRNNLRKGDLVFFATGGGNRVSHVGIYIGSNKFIHAPSRGKKVRIESINSYWQRRYVGAKSYL